MVSNVVVEDAKFSSPGSCLGIKSVSAAGGVVHVASQLSDTGFDASDSRFDGWEIISYVA